MKKECIRVEKEIPERRNKKLNIAGAVEPKESAKSGLWSKKNQRNRSRTSNESEDVFAVGYKHHVQRQKEKMDWRSEQIQNGKDQVIVMRNIGVSIHCMSMTDRDYWASWKDFVMNEYKPVSARDDILELGEKNKDDCIDLWRVIARKPDLYDADRTNDRVNSLYKRWLNRNQ